MYMLALMACSVLAASASEHEKLIRTDGGRRTVSIDTHSHMQVVPDHEQPITDEPASMTEQGSKGENPCSSLGCNSHKCEWASGGRITRVESKQACSNAVMVGSANGLISVAPAAAAATSMLAKSGDAPADEAAAASAPALQTVDTGAAAAAVATDASTMAKVVTLRDCMNAVRSKSASTCSGHFQLHKDTMACMCVPAGQTCAATEDENICRYQVVEPK